MDYVIFKNEMMLLKAYRKALETLTDEKEEIEYQMCGVRGIRYDKQHSSYNPSQSENIRLDLIDKLSQKESEIAEVNKILEPLENRCRTRLKRLTPRTRQIVRMKFEQDMTFDEIGGKLGYSNHAIWYKLTREVESL